MTKFDPKKAAKAIARNKAFCVGKLAAGMTEAEIREEFPQFTRGVDFSALRIPTPQESICNALMSAAGRAQAFGQKGATPKQCGYLANLLAAKGLATDDIDMANSNALLSSLAASTLINLYA